MLLAMVVRSGRARGVQSRFDPLLLATSVLGLVWNLCALPGVRAPQGRHRRAVPAAGGRRVRRARVPAGGGRALGAPRRARWRPRRREAVDCDRGLRGQRHRRGAAPLFGVDRPARAVGARHAPAHLHVRGARGSAGRGHSRTTRIARACGRPRSPPSPSRRFT